MKPQEHPMTPEEVIRLAAVDVRERPEEEAMADALSSIQRDELRIKELESRLAQASAVGMKLIESADARIRQLEQERDEAVGLLREWEGLDWLVE
jgi:hypothetical protein